MLRMFEFKCSTCNEYKEALVNDPIEDAPECTHGHGKMAKIISTPAFNFANGAGTDMGRSWAIPGHPLPPIN